MHHNLKELEKTKMIKHTLKIFPMSFLNSCERRKKRHLSSYIAYVTNETCFENTMRSLLSSGTLRILGRNVFTFSLSNGVVFFYVHLFILRERERESREGAEIEGERESQAGSELTA